MKKLYLKLRNRFGNWLFRLAKRVYVAQGKRTKKK